MHGRVLKVSLCVYFSKEFIEVMNVEVCCEKKLEILRKSVQKMVFDVKKTGNSEFMSPKRDRKDAAPPCERLRLIPKQAVSGKLRLRRNNDFVLKTFKKTLLYGEQQSQRVHQPAVRAMVSRHSNQS